MGTDNKQADKKVYTTPKLVAYGSIRELTKAAGCNQPPRPDPSRPENVCVSNCK